MEVQELKIHQSILPYNGQFQVKHSMRAAMLLEVLGAVIRQPFTTIFLRVTRQETRLLECRDRSISAIM